MPRTIALVVGSLRKESWTRKVAVAITALAPPSLTFESIEIGVENADLSSIDLGMDGQDSGGDPLARKLELAEEFRQIGDMEGARDLLQEVIARANGALKSKAEGMLNSLA